METNDFTKAQIVEAKKRSKAMLEDFRNIAQKQADAKTAFQYSGAQHRYFESVIRTLMDSVALSALKAADAEDIYEKRIATLQKRLEEVERRGMEYRGVFRKGMSCKTGDVVTHQGCAWVCKMPTDTSVPGDGSQCFQMFVKAGRNGKDYTGDKV